MEEKIEWENEFEAWLKLYVEKHGLEKAQNAEPKMLWQLGFWEAAHLIKAEIPKLVEAENKRCQEVMARVFEDLGEQGVTLDQLQRAVTISQLPDVM